MVKFLVLGASGSKKIKEFGVLEINCKKLGVHQWQDKGNLPI